MYSIFFRKRNLVSLFVSFTLLPLHYVVYADEKKTDLGHIQISDNKEKDKQGYAQVYEKDVANIYLGKELLERYQGVSPADLLKSAIGVYSGDARNGGAIDPNIRGIQGQGRIPVTVDGTEQAITVYRGYSGASNRNYIDSNLISSIYIEKGPSFTPDMKTGIGGGIAIKTLDIRDIVPIGESFGINLKGDISNNTTRYKRIYTNMVEEYRNYPKFFQDGAFIIDPALEITPQKQKITRFKDYSLRLGVGFEKEKFNLLFAYALREKGNYIAGKRNANKYKESDKDTLKSIFVGDGKRNFEPYLPFIAHIYRPNNEVSNTSSRNRSSLVKGTLFPQATHRFSMNYRYTNLLFGDIMPSRLNWVRYNKNVVNQWPLADITQHVGALTYQWKPEDNKKDLLLRFWGNLTSGHTNTRGGKPREPKNIDYYRNRNTQWSYNTDTSFIDTASLYQDNNRYGTDISSTVQLSPYFSASFTGNYQYEQLSNSEIDSSTWFNPFVTGGRSGKRHELSLALSTDWKPLNWLSVSVGGKYQYYRLSDDYLNEKRRNKVEAYKKRTPIRGYVVNYKRVLTPQEYLYYRAIYLIDVETLPDELKRFRIDPEITQKIRDFRTIKFIYPEYEKLSPEERNAILNRPEIKTHQIEMMFDDYIRDAQGNLQIKSPKKIPMKLEATAWLYNEHGQLPASKNILLNGYIDLNEKTINPMTGEQVYKYEMIPMSKGQEIYIDETNKDPYQEEPAYQHKAWSPLISATVYANDMLRFYGRYTEQLRLPTLFEDTSGFSGSKANYYGFKLKPERAKSTELGVVLDLSQWLNAQRHADIKLNYFNTHIENVFDRDHNWQIVQLEKQILSGAELQARFDNGFLFIDTALVYSHKNLVCDENAFRFIDFAGLLGAKQCMTGGYPGGFLRTSIQPKYSVNFHIGTRWLNDTLEIGSRWLYSSEVENKDEKWLKEKLPQTYFGQNNNPMRWAKVFTVDAYLNYQYNPNLSFEIVGSNLLDEYYIDPLTRSGMPAPGRTIKFGITAQF
ncbi:TonB-dependent receptor domain-containing protein [Proteus myxofaciens]|uniref:TonB-dependent receptor domain-containing protein n=1 Tax=Proteus myxofaciens TaxID=184072 RepID=UPI0008325657|nr:TonB-dependent receptor [Proteus myxofaciens]